MTIYYPSKKDLDYIKRLFPQPLNPQVGIGGWSNGAGLFLYADERSYEITCLEQGILVVNLQEGPSLIPINQIFEV